MTPQEFQNSWTNTGEPLSPLSKSRLEKFDLQKATFDFLHIAGLPAYCEPNLSFANDTDDIFYSIHKLTDLYDYLTEEYEPEDNQPAFDKYIVIGSCRDGDVIAIDTGDNDKIVELDHEDSFSSMYFNSSIAALANFLILYRDFEAEVLQDKDPDDNFQCYNFTDEQIERLINNMYAVDSKAITEHGFWKDELEIMYSLRQEKFPA
ncbi:SUKH-4 family immunity protein [Mucilaginibacter angelicae]|uniref:SUKH-4 family immunity protein n=1 Tax=Mucilaginibacter angelicae TaxID=869718 RepID=A0ABV6KYL9_9SPHI